MLSTYKKRDSKISDFISVVNLNKKERVSKEQKERDYALVEAANDQSNPGSVKARNTLIELYLWMPKFVASKLCKKYSKQNKFIDIEVQELVDAGIDGLIDGIRKFKVDKARQSDNGFSTYAMWWVFARVDRLCKKMVKNMGINSLSASANVQDYMSGGSVSSHRGGNSNADMKVKLVNDNIINSEKVGIHYDMSDLNIAIKALAKQSKHRRKIVKMVINKDMKFAEIANAMGSSRQYVSRSYYEAIEKMRKEMGVEVNHNCEE